MSLEGLCIFIYIKLRLIYLGVHDFWNILTINDLKFERLIKNKIEGTPILKLAMVKRL